MSMIWSSRYLSRMDIRVIPVILALMFMGILVLASQGTPIDAEGFGELFRTPIVKKQLQFFALAWGVFLFFAGFDYNKLREWAWILYAVTVISLVGLFFTDSIARVHRWYRIPLVGFNFQPCELAKLAVVISLSWFLERKKDLAGEWSTALYSAIIVGIPFLLILKQPDLGSALVLFPITLVMFYFGGIRPIIIKVMSWFGGILLLVVALFFLEVVSHEAVKPYALTVMKEYQYDRLKPNNHHQKAAITAIAIGGVTGSGFKKSEFTGGGWLPAPYTDSVFPAFGEEFGFIGLLIMMALFYLLLYFCFQASVAAKDHFGRLLAAGIGVYLAMHIVVNVGMMTGFLPITGVPLVLVTQGGSSVLATMAALGIVQSVYSRRFMF